MPQSTPLRAARQILGDDVIGLDEITKAFGAGARTASADTVPFSTMELERAKGNGELLILRAAECAGAPITVQWLIDHAPAAFDHAVLRKVGYQLKDDWGIELEQLAATETCKPQWALVRKDVLPETRNLPYDAQDALLHDFATSRAAAGHARRRSAVEIVFDILAVHGARGQRLLTANWDWSLSRTADGGYLNVGRFTEAGMQIFSYSRAVRHGKLGVCPTIDPIIA